MRKTLFLLPILVAASCVSAPAWAGVVYSNLGVGGAVYDPFNGAGVTGSAVLGGVPFSPGFSFTPASTAVFTELDIALQFFSGTDLATVKLMSDASGLPGGVLESWSVSGLATAFTCCTMQTLLGSGATTLNSGTPYWVTVFAGSTDTFVVWNANTTGPTGTLMFNDGTGWAVSTPPVTGPFTTGAFAVLGAPDAATGVPEPGTGALALAAGALTLMMMRRTVRQRS